jgi:hypothetical protein
MASVISRRLSTQRNVVSNGHLQITNILHQLLFAMDRNDHELFASLFTQNGSCEVKKAGLIVSGSENLGNLCKSIHSKFSPALHMEANVVLDISDIGTATNKSYWYAVLGGEIVSTGFHYDSFVLTKNREGTESWKVENRVIEHHWTKEGGFDMKV